MGTCWAVYCFGVLSLNGRDRNMFRKEALQAWKIN